MRVHRDDRGPAAIGSLTRIGAWAILFSIGPVVPASAIIVRHDIAESRYRVAESYYPPLVDLPVEGHGVLIADRWVVTVAHALTWREGAIRQVTINGRSRAVASITIHPGYRDPPGALLRGDAGPLLAFQRARADIALIRLAEPVRDVVPSSLYRGWKERGHIVEIIGRGASGDGIAGESPQAPHRGPLRRAQNRIAHAEGAWLSYVFDRGAKALPLEGMLGGGDSGGPVLLRVGREWQLAGLASWQDWDGDLAAFRGGTYGRISYQIRIAHYAGWIDSVTRGQSGR